jgi:phosphoesterase RecJ-like protein
MSTNYDADLVSAANRLAAGRRPLLLSHAKPDGDAIGSLIGLTELLAGRGVGAVPVVFDDVPLRYRWVDEKSALRRLGRDLTEKDLDAFDSVIVVDTCTYNQIEPIAAWLRRSKLAKHVIDHHQTRDELADHYLIDESAAATCLVLHDLATKVGWPVSQSAAKALFVGIATDTGWFRHSNTDARVLGASADLVNRGVVPNEVFDRIYQSDKAARIRLLGRAIESLELLEGGRVAVMSLAARVFAEVGAEAADTEDIVNEPMRIESVVVSLMLVEQEGVVRVNLRSRAPRGPGDPDIDVAAVAGRLGGGGHRRAAGVRLRGGLQQAREMVLDALRA